MAHVVVGLGNPGEEYRETRHNVGQRVLDHMADEPLGRKPWRRDDSTLVSAGRWRGEDVILVKPLAFMNVCGPVIARSLRRGRAAPPKQIQVYEDQDQPQGGGGGTRPPLRR